MEASQPCRSFGGDDRRAPAQVLNAVDDDTRARRADTLSLARAADPIPISEAVMVTWARLVADCRAAGSQRTIKLTDALIAATAVEHGLPSSSRMATTRRSPTHTRLCEW